MNVSDSSRLPWYAHFPGDWMRQTRGWSIAERGLARELFDCQWDQGALPAKPEDIRKFLGATTGEWKAWRRVEALFPISADGNRRNAELAKQRERAIDVSQKRALAGRAGGLRAAIAKANAGASAQQAGRDSDSDSYSDSETLTLRSASSASSHSDSLVERHRKARKAFENGIDADVIKRSFGITVDELRASRS